MFGHQPQQQKAAAQSAPVTGAFSSMTLSFQFHLNRLPENSPSIATSNPFREIFGDNMLDRLLQYLYIFDVATQTNTAIERDEKGKDISSTFAAVISGFRGNVPFSVTFTDVPALHQWLEANHVIPNIHDGKMVIDKDGVKEVLENHPAYQRYIETHVTNPLLTSLKREVTTLHSDKLNLERQIKDLTDQVKKMEQARDAEQRLRMRIALV